MHDLQHPYMISFISRRRFWIAPLRIVLKAGMRDGFLTMKAISSSGSPPMQKNSNSASSTTSRKARWVANRTRCPCAFSSFPNAMNGCMSPRDPITCMTRFMLNGKSFPRSLGIASGVSFASSSSKSGSNGAFWMRFSKPAMLGLCSLIFISSRPSPVKYERSVSTSC